MLVNQQPLNAHIKSIAADHAVATCYYKEGTLFVKGEFVV